MGVLGMREIGATHLYLHNRTYSYISYVITWPPDTDHFYCPSQDMPCPDWIAKMFDLAVLGWC